MDESVRELRLANLAKGRGKRPTANTEPFMARMHVGDRALLDLIAESKGCTYGGKPSIGALLHKIAVGEIVLVDKAIAQKLLKNLS
jgi:hypothetical protein